MARNRASGVSEQKLIAVYANSEDRSETRPG